jgi:hypothetical protein
MLPAQLSGCPHQHQAGSQAWSFLWTAAYTCTVFGDSLHPRDENPWRKKVDWNDQKDLFGDLILRSEISLCLAGLKNV